MIKECPMRHKNGNCLPIGGFCLSVNEGICRGLMQAYECGQRTGIVEQKKGKWIAHNNLMYSPFDGSNENTYICNQCEAEAEKATNYCPNCGADMRKEKTDETN